MPLVDLWDVAAHKALEAEESGSGQRSPSSSGSGTVKTTRLKRR
jgi:hypothetical protein